MRTKKQLPVMGKRHNFVLFVASLIPTLKVNVNGEIELEFPVVDFLVEKVVGLISKKKKKKDEQMQELKPHDSTSEDEEQEEPGSNGAANEDSKQENEDDKYSRKAADKQLEDSLESTVQKSKPDTTWDKVAGLQNAKSQLQIAAEMPEKQPALFTGNRKAPQFILLYGPPGTGKGHLAKALCNSVDSTLFIVSASDMTSKWVGESER
jgi:vacuolar protein-sorting-associated protein 4